MSAQQQQDRAEWKMANFMNFKVEQRNFHSGTPDQNDI